jgi:hypothetical protein
VCGETFDYITLFDTLDTSGCVWTYTLPNTTVLGPYVCQNLVPSTCVAFRGTLNVFLTWQPIKGQTVPVIHVQQYLEQLGLGKLQSVGNMQLTLFDPLPTPTTLNFLPTLQYVNQSLVISEFNSSVRHSVLSSKLCCL